ncbi:MAG: hypothetical protein CVT92_12950 [Bacteroidetes bacterium HGW-Bacteroidetes-1]|jgi:outer membrane protein TolC|nr:MAG: hypothetical protein CVT92_12950 [Bacteroidetes bacterium HGW-Bacteroidetes-1]
MKTKNRWLIINLLILCGFSLNAQDNLSLQDAIRTGLENNFGIRLVKMDVEIASNNNSIGNSGFLPKLNLTAAQSYSVTDSKQEFLTGQINDRSGAKADALNAGLQLNWTIFDGLRMFVRYDQLQQLEQKSELQLLFTVENTINSIHTTYHTLVQLMHQQKVLEKTLKIDNERLKIASHKIETGAGSRLEVLQAQVDMNTDSAAYFNLDDQIGSSKINLNQLLGRDPQLPFLVSDSIIINNLPVIEILIQQMMERNTSLALGRKDEQLAQIALREIRGRQLPEIGFNLGYNFVNQNSESGFLIQNRSLGLTYSLNASMNLFNGFNTRREQQNLQIQIESSRVRIESLENELRANLERNYNSYSNKLRLIAMEKQNLLAANENLDITAERFRLGDISGIEFREAQRNYLQAELRLLSVTLETKILETSLMQLAGILVTE